MLGWYRKHPDQPWLTPQQQLSMNKLNQQESEAGTYNDAFNPGGSGNQGIYKSGGGFTSPQATESRWERYQKQEQDWLQKQPGSEQLWQTPPPAALPESAPSDQSQPVPPNVTGPDVTQPAGEEG